MVSSHQQSIHVQNQQFLLLRRRRYHRRHHLLLLIHVASSSSVVKHFRSILHTATYSVVKHFSIHKPLAIPHIPRELARERERERGSTRRERIDANQSQQKKADYCDASNSNFLTPRSSNHNCCIYYLHFQTPTTERHTRANSKTLTIAPSFSSANGFLVVQEPGPIELVIPW